MDVQPSGPRRVSVAGWLAMLTMAGAAMGCGGQDTTPGAPQVMLGGGLESYVALSDGDEVELVLGQQGGWHVDLATRFVDVVPDGVTLTYRLKDDATDEQLAYPIKVFVVRENALAMPDGSYTRSGDRVIIIGTPANVVGRNVRAELDAIVDGELLEDERSFVVVDELP